MVRTGRSVGSILCFWMQTFAGAALAGGFDRFDQDTSLLFDPGKFIIDVSGSYVLTNRHYVTVEGKATDVPSLEDYAAGSFKLKGNPSDNTSCMVNAGRPYGSEIDYGIWEHANRSIAQTLRVSELALTCAFKATAGTHAFYAIGGIAYNKLRFEQAALITSATPTSLAVGSSEFNWRMGAAYSLPSSGFLASVLYYAPMYFEFDGSIRNLPLSPTLSLAGTPVGGYVEFPQAVEVQVRGFIAPAWMLGVGFKWADWSVLDHVPFKVSGPSVLPVGTELLDLQTHFRDGLSAALFVGHQFDKQWSVLARLGWDRAVETGWTSHSEVWSLQTTAFYKLDAATELRLSLNAARLGAGAIDKGGVHATWGFDYALVPSAGITVRFD